jgi:hypothetical protein
MPVGAPTAVDGGENGLLPLLLLHPRSKPEQMVITIKVVYWFFMFLFL